MSKPIEEAVIMAGACKNCLCHTKNGSHKFTCVRSDLGEFEEPCTVKDFEHCPFNSKAVFPPVKEPEQKSGNFIDDLKGLDFADQGKLFEAAYHYFGLVKTKAEPLIKKYDLKVPAQRKLAWLDIIENQRRQPGKAG